MPIKGTRVVVTRAGEQASGFARKLRQTGAKVTVCPAIRIVTPKSYAPLDRAIRNIDSYDWIIFTSVNGVDHFLKRWKRIAKRKPFPSGTKTFAIGPATAARTRAAGLPVTRVSKDYVAESILKEMTRVKKIKVLIPRAEKARNILPDTLRKRGADVDVVTAYRTLPDRKSAAILRRIIQKGNVQCVTFTSSSTVDNFFRAISKQDRVRIAKENKICAASIGPVTTRTLRQYHWTPVIVARKPTTEHLLRAIVRYFTP